MRRLLIRPGGIGDCILSLPALEYLKAEYTEVWAPSSVIPLIQFADAVRPIASTGLDLMGVGDLPTPAHLSTTLRTFDSIVTWYGSNRAAFRQAVLALGVPCQFHHALPSAGFNGHATDYFAQQVGAPRGLNPRIEIVPELRRDSVVIHPFSGGLRKNWALACFRELASRLPCSVEWTAGPGEQLEGATRFTDLADLARWMTAARLYIGNDSGITHLAAALGIRTLALFGPTRPRAWAPRGANVTIMYSDPLERLKVERVLGTANRLLVSP